ncbi:hydrolase [Amylibacter ulvae]|uniref:Hydrolase n=1 Tax=Paramylibacter ulvae TaxID=1651968 RepID=A0ABQ3DCL1_9RHOB|nr:alpha/beta hydrolase [Amylibacter ulvae]GHA62454.1 hydrolase [Amylibacter ulvae]
MNAPFHKSVARAPKGTICNWMVCSDGKRIRVAGWKGGDKGTVLLFQGRTEYIEKYGAVATRFVEMGYSVVAVDWRGQGLSDRFGASRTIGHVDDFADFQLDIAAVNEFITEQGFPAPEVALCHSMGGAIGLRALHNGLPVKKVIFSAPMWGIYLSPMMKPVASAVSSLSAALGKTEKLAPTTTLQNYAMVQEFKGNTLTNNADEYAMIRKQISSFPDLELGGPSVHWMRKAMEETATLCEMPAPKTDCLCFLGSNEQIVDKDCIRNVMNKWPNGELVILDNAQHEVMLEEDHITADVWKRIESFLAD